MKVLSLEQMHQLKELGIDVKPKELCLVYSRGGWREYRLKYQKLYYSDDIKAFTLQDIIELLPKTLTHQFLSPTLRITKDSVEYVDYSFFENVFTEYSEYDEKSDILNAAYNMIIWVAENGYLTSK